MTTTRKLLACLTILMVGTGLTLSAVADDAATKQVTFYKDIVPIFQENCQTCHRPAGANKGGMIAPMSFMTYQEVRPWAKSIANKVRAREMPPWFATAETHGQFVNERVLTDEQIETIVNWTRTGAARGRIEDAPPAVQWTDHEGWAIGTPDLIINLAEPFWVEDSVEDLNITVKAGMITKEMMPEPRYIAAAEFRPGSGAVHHIIASRRPQDAEEPGASGMLGGIAPGSDPFYLPEGVGRLLMPNTQIYFQMHYHKESGPGTGVMDHSQMAIKFHPKGAKVEKLAEWYPVGNRTFEIPPGHTNWQVGASEVFDKDTTIYAYLPHMHLRGKAAKYVAYYPDGTRETLLDVPKYDFNWQVNYTYREPKTIPAGTRIEVTMWFDNSLERKALVPGINVNRPVRFGGPTTDEMMLGWMDFAKHEPADVASTDE